MLQCQGSPYVRRGAITSSHYDDVILVICIVQISHHAVVYMHIYLRNMFTKYTLLRLCNINRIDDKKGVTLCFSGRRAAAALRMTLCCSVNS